MDLPVTSRLLEGKADLLLCDIEGPLAIPSVNVLSLHASCRECFNARQACVKSVCAGFC
jgi:hypothetical protein